MLTSNDYARAILVQDACNLSGIVHAWHEVVSKIWEEANVKGKGTDWVNTHPINVLFANKIYSLTHSHVDDDSLSAFAYAYGICQEKASKDV